MNLLEAVSTRRSINSFATDREVPGEKIRLELLTGADRESPKTY